MAVKAAKAALSYIEPDEEAEARKVIQDHMKELTGHTDIPRPAGFYLMVKIYVPEKIGQIHLAADTKNSFQYTSMSALVIACGPESYQGTDHAGAPRFPGGPWCKPGDWVVIPRYESFMIKWRGVAMALLPDDKVIAVIQDPSVIGDMVVADKF